MGLFFELITEKKYMNTKNLVRKGAGRPVGAKNRTSAEIKSLICQVLEDEFCNIEQLLNDLSSRDRLDFIARLLKYVVPVPAPETDENTALPVMQPPSITYILNRGVE